MDRAAQEELLDIIVRNAKRLQLLADDILDVTKKRAIHIRDGGIEKEVLNVERQ
jgi:signal transduction histidine kinase